MLIGYLIPGARVERSYPVQGLLELYDIYLGAIGKNILYFLGLGVEEGLNQKSIRTSLNEGFKQAQESPL